MGRDAPQLPDCRHYTFYLWKDFFAVPGAKVTLVPMYLYSAWSIWHSLVEGSLPRVGILGLCAASCLTLIPAWLLDFRRAHADACGAHSFYSRLKRSLLRRALVHDFLRVSIPLVPAMFDVITLGCF